MTEENINTTQQDGTAAPTAVKQSLMANIIEMPKDELKIALHTVPSTTVMVDPFKPKNLAEAMALADMMAKSTIVPTD